MPGINTLEHSKEVEVTNISPFGFWLLSRDKEYFVSFEDYPVFADASILDIATVRTDVLGNFHWPALDADIEVDALETPDEYPLSYT